MATLDAGNLTATHTHSNAIGGTARLTQAVAEGAHPANRLETLVARLTTHEWRRRLLHVSPGLLVVVLLLIPHADPLGLPARLILPTVIGATCWFALKSEALYRRRGEREWPISVVSYGVITASLLLAFPGQPEIGMAVTMIIAFGDGSATLAGLLVRGRRLPWNSAKSWAGTAAFVLCATPLATLVYWAEARPGVTLPLACACVAPAALMGAFVESLPLRINDNIRVGLTAGLTMLLTQALFVGW